MRLASSAQKRRYTPQRSIGMTGAEGGKALLLIWVFVGTKMPAFDMSKEAREGIPELQQVYTPDLRFFVHSLNENSYSMPQKSASDICRKRCLVLGLRVTKSDPKVETSLFSESYSGESIEREYILHCGTMKASSCTGT